GGGTRSVRHRERGGRLQCPALFCIAMPRHRAAGPFRHRIFMDAWPRCLQRLEAEFPGGHVHTWLKPLQAHERDDGYVLYAPNAFVMEEVRARYLARIRELIAHFAGAGDVSLEVGSLREPGPGGASP